MAFSSPFACAIFPLNQRSFLHNYRNQATENRDDGYPYWRKSRMPTVHDRVEHAGLVLIVKKEEEEEGKRKKESSSYNNIFP